jgi:rod shape-determining protein MreC
VPSVYGIRRVRRRRRIVLIGLVVVSIALLTVYFGESGAPSGVLHALQSGTEEVLSPIESGASAVASPFRSVGNWVSGVVTAQSDRDKLRRQVAQLQGDLARTAADRRDADQLRALDGLQRAPGFPQGLNIATANVVVRSPDIWHSSTQIDKGTNDGISTDDPVITAGGLVGKIGSAGPTSSRVTLITDASSAVSGQVLPDGVEGVVQPRVGQPDDLLLNFLDKNRRIAPGDPVVTSGSTNPQLQSLFPRGIPIGQVSSVDPNELSLYQRVHVRPFADLQSMDMVQVIRKPGVRTASQVNSP